MESTEKHEFPLKLFNRQIVRRGIVDPRVLAAIREIPRSAFVPDELKASAYNDGPLPIGEEQTISQPYIVAFMSEAARIQPTDRVLEVGTGCGYQTAVLCHLAHEVRSVEIRENLANKAHRRLKQLGYKNVRFRIGDGRNGWPEDGPYDAILVTAAPESVPPALLDQLKIGGRLIIPVGNEEQQLKRIIRDETGNHSENLMPVRFVPFA